MHEICCVSRYNGLASGLVRLEGNWRYWEIRVDILSDSTFRHPVHIVIDRSVPHRLRREGVDIESRGMSIDYHSPR